MNRSENKSLRFTGIRMMIAIQVFSFLLAIITGFFALEVGSVELNRSLRSAPFYTFQDSIERFLFRSPKNGRPPPMDEQMPVKQVRAALNKMRLTVLICGFVAFFTGIVLDYTIKNTLRKLTRSLGSVERGDFTENLEIYSHEEIGQVAKAYNRMVSSVNRYMLETSAGATFTINRDGIITSFNPMAEIMFHRDYRDAVGAHFTDIFPVSKKNRDFMEIIVKGIDKGEPSSRENLLIVTPEGEKKVTKITTSILSSDTGKLVEVVANFGDFEQVNEIQTQMERMNRLASLGSLVAGLAHEIRTPLGSLKGFTQLLGEDLPEEDKKRKYTEIILKEIDRLNKVVEELLSFAQPTGGEFEARDINEIVRDALLLVQASFPGKPVQVIERYDPDLPKVLVERNRLVQAILNILNNAFEATPDQERIIIETSREKDGIEGASPENATGARSVVIDFTNTGTAVSFEEAKRMFDPFFTTKEKGTGLGLAIAQQVMTAHGGSLRVINQPGTNHQERVTFRMELPIKGSMDRMVSESLGPS
jgi:two-component system nitrogen regulation sensor histidine kinase GlnL